MRMNNFIVSVTLLVFLSTGSTFSQVEKIDKFFVGINKSMRSIPSSTIQNWMRVQYNFYVLDSLLSTLSDKSEIKNLKFVAGYGYNVIKLYDIAAKVQLSAIDDDNSKANFDLLKDVAQTWEDMGDFAKACYYREKAASLETEPDLTNNCNLSLSYLKNKQYEKCIETVNKIELTKETAHTRLFSARAYGYLGKYVEAVNELKKYGNLSKNNINATINEIDSTTPEIFWRKDLEKRQNLWQPDNKIKSDDLAKFKDFECSEYTISAWFDEIYNLNPKIKDQDYSPYKPIQNKDAKYCFVIIKGIPFFAFKFPGLKEYQDSRDELTKFEENIHWLSAWDEKMELKNQIFTGTVNGQIISIITHNSWQEELLIKQFPDVEWNKL